MATNYRGYGRSINIPAPVGGVLSGSGVLIGVTFGVAGADANVGDLFALHLDGIFVLPKVSAQAWTVGAAIYWDQQLNNCTTVATSGHTKIGVCSTAAANPSATGEVRLNGAF